MCAKHLPSNRTHSDYLNKQSCSSCKGYLYNFRDLGILIYFEGFRDSCIRQGFSKTVQEFRNHYQVLFKEYLVSHTTEDSEIYFWVLFRTLMVLFTIFTVLFTTFTVLFTTYRVLFTTFRVLFTTFTVLFTILLHLHTL